MTLATYPITAVQGLIEHLPTSMTFGLAFFQYSVGLVDMAYYTVSTRVLCMP